EKLNDAEVDRWMEPHPTFVRAQRTVELDSESAVDLNLPAVILPGHPKDQLSFGFTQSLKNLRIRELGMFGQHRAERLQDLTYGLMKLVFSLISLDNLLINRFELFG